MLRPAPALRADHGFTLIEVLVGMVVGMVVVGALFAVLEVSLHQNSRLADRVSADQRGRTAMENILQLVQSSCVAPNFTPIETGSTATAIRLIAAPNKEDQKAAFKEVTLHEIKLESTKLVDYTYPSQGSAPNWTFKLENPTKHVLLEGVAQVEPKAGEKTPVFRYYGYGAEGKLSTTPLEVPLTEARSNEAAALSVTFAAYPETGNTTNKRTFEISDYAVLRFSPSSLTTTNTPCA